MDVEVADAALDVSPTSLRGRISSIGLLPIAGGLADKGALECFARRVAFYVQSRTWQRVPADMEEGNAAHDAKRFLTPAARATRSSLGG